MWNLEKRQRLTNLLSKAEIELQMQRTNFRLQAEVGWIGRLTLTYIHCCSVSQSCPILCKPGQAPLFSTVSQSFLRFMSIESVMLPNHLILCCSLLLLPSVFPSISLSTYTVLCQPARPLCPWGFSRQEHWSGLPCPPPGDPTLKADSLLSVSPGKPMNTEVGSLSLLQGLFLTQDQTRVTCIEGRFLTS